jgi:hypothetical protein
MPNKKLSRSREATIGSIDFVSRIYRSTKGYFTASIN